MNTTNGTFTSNSSDTVYDFIVVGGGSAGCVLARRLAENPEASVLLLEAGPDDAGLDAISTASGWAGLLGGSYDWGYSYDPAPAAANRSIPIPRGKVLGGSGSINAMLWYRGHRDDYNRWAAGGATGWDYESLLPYFKKSEDWQYGETEYRGAGGPLRIETSPDPHPVAAALLTGAAELGLSVLEDANAASNEGAALANFNAATGPDGILRRVSPSAAYLRPAAGWPNLCIRTNTSARRLVIERGRAAGVIISPTAASGSRGNSSDTATIRARAGVVLTLGAIDTPRLLMLSGIGDTPQLRAAGIEPLLHLPGVGANFQDHPLLMGVNFRLRAPLDPIRDNGGGAMLNWRSQSADHRPDLHAFVVQGRHTNPALAKQYGVDGDVCAVSPGLMRSQSIGSIRLLDAAGKLSIDPNYLAEQADLDALVESLDWMLDLAATSGYAGLLERPLSPPRRLDRAEAVAFVRASVDTFFHCSGTAKMGADEASVVTPELAVRGLEGLWVADASVIPEIPTCNLQAPVVAIAERAAELIATASGIRPASAASIATATPATPTATR